MSAMDPTDPNDAWQLRYHNTLEAFRLALLDLYSTNPWPKNQQVLDHAISHIATDLWRSGFSQAQIRQAYEAALAHLPVYAAGDETRQ